MKMFLFWMVMMDCGLLNWVYIGRLVSAEGMIVQCFDSLSSISYDRC